jgi:hypothetical protein
MSNTQNGPRFLPARGDEAEGTHIALTTGHACRVHAVSPVDGERGTCIPDRFRREAVALGCPIVGVDDEKEQAKDDAETQQSLIVAAIRTIIEADDKDQLQGDGRPKADAVSKVVGFNVTKAKYTKAWAAFAAELDGEDGPEEV